MGVLRWVRAAVVALVSSGLALASHLAAGGPVPRPGTAAALVLLVLMVSLGLSGRRWTLGPLLAMLLGAQALFHVAAGPAGRVHPEHLGAATGHPGISMVGAHLAAALVTALLLRRGDDWAWRLGESVARVWRAARVVDEHGTPQVAHFLGLATAAEQPGALRLLEHAVDRRGPPSRAAA